MRRTKIISTFGPSISDPKILKDVCQYADVIRINLAHGTWDENEKYNHKRNIQLIKDTAKKLKKPVAILVDLKGNKIRIGDFKDHMIELEHASDIDIIFTKEKKTNKHEIFIDADYCFPNIEVGDKILLDDGLIQLVVERTSQKNMTLHCKVEKGGLLRSNKGFEVENKIIHRSGLGEEDKRDIGRLAELGVDWIALSFVNEASDVTQAREVLTQIGSPINLIAKIERLEALKQLFWIIKASDGVMVARGDLALESGPGELTGLQKDIIKQTVKGKRIAITATQMMESMISQMSPTRAEVNDVANAVLDGADAVMLSGETSVGRYPVEVISTMSRIVCEMESHDGIYYKEEAPEKNKARFISDSICYNSCRLAQRVDVNAIITMSFSGYTAYKIASQRPKAQIFVFTSNRKILTQLNLVWGVRAFYYNKLISTDHTIADIKNIMKSQNYLKQGDLIINIASIPLEDLGSSNMLKLSHVD